MKIAKYFENYPEERIALKDFQMILSVTKVLEAVE